MGSKVVKEVWNCPFTVKSNLDTALILLNVIIKIWVSHFHVMPDIHICFSLSYTPP